MLKIISKFPKIFEILQIRDSSFVANTFLSTLFFSIVYLSKWACDSDSRKPLFLT